MINIAQRRMHENCENSNKKSSHNGDCITAQNENRRYDRQENNDPTVIHNAT